MAECILISSDTEKASSDDELPSFSSVLKGKTVNLPPPQKIKELYGIAEPPEKIIIIIDLLN